MITVASITCRCSMCQLVKKETCRHSSFSLFMQNIWIYLYFLSQKRIKNHLFGIPSLNIEVSYFRKDLWNTFFLLFLGEKSNSFQVHYYSLSKKRFHSRLLGWADFFHRSFPRFLIKFPQSIQLNENFWLSLIPYGKSNLFIIKVAKIDLEIAIRKYLFQSTDFFRNYRP